MTHFSGTRPGRLASAGLLVALLSACGALAPTQSAPPAFYSLDGAAIDASPPLRTAARSSAPTLIVTPPRAAPGFDSQHIVYRRVAHQLEYYAHSEWIAPPARMIAPLIVAALETGGGFGAVVATPGAAAGDLRLDTEIVRLQHEIQDTGGSPSRVRLTLRAYLLDNTTRSVIAWHEFDESVSVTSENPYGAVVAANQAVRTVLEKLAVSCAKAADSRHAKP